MPSIWSRIMGTSRLEHQMSELTDAVQALSEAVGSLSERIGTRVDELEASLAAANQALADFTLADDLEDAEFVAQITSLQEALGTALGEAAAAVEGIKASVSTIQDVTGQANENPEVPVEPPVEEPPVEEVPGEEPAPEEPPVDNS